MGGPALAPRSPGLPSGFGRPAGKSPGDDGPVMDGAVVGEALVDSALVDGAVVDGAVMDGAVMDGPLAVVDSAVANGPVPDSPVADGVAGTAVAGGGPATESTPAGDSSSPGRDPAGVSQPRPGDSCPSCRDVRYRPGSACSGGSSPASPIITPLLVRPRAVPPPLRALARAGLIMEAWCPAAGAISLTNIESIHYELNKVT